MYFQHQINTIILNVMLCCVQIDRKMDISKTNVAIILFICRVESFYNYFTKFLKVYIIFFLIFPWMFFILHYLVQTTCGSGTTRYSTTSQLGIIFPGKVQSINSLHTPTYLDKPCLINQSHYQTSFVRSQSIS